MVQICVTFIIDRVPYFYFLLNEADDKSTPLLFLGPTYVRKRGVKMFENMLEKLLKYAFFPNFSPNVIDAFDWHCLKLFSVT